MNPTVSIIIPYYNQGEYIEDAIRSVVMQDFPLGQLEIIVVNDGSSELDTGKLLDLGKYYPFSYKYQNNRGLPMARNSGLMSAKGEWIVPLDADDMLAPSYLAEVLGCAEAGGDIIYTSIKYFGIDDIEVKLYPEITKELLIKNNIPPYCSLIKRELAISGGGYNPNLVYGLEDWDFWLTMLERGAKFQYLDKPLFLYRRRENSMVANTMKHYEEAFEQIKKNHPGLYA